MIYIFFIIALASMFGVAFPFIKSLKRWHFAVSAVASIMILHALTPPPRPLTQEEIKQRAAADAKKSAEHEQLVKEQKKAEDERNVVAQREQARKMLAQLAKDTIIEAARDPSSVSFSFVGVNEDASLVCVGYRARNGFGGMNIEFVAFKNGNPKQSSSFWNSNCRSVMYNYT